MIDEIQRRIDDLQPHAIVLGLGPSAARFNELQYPSYTRVYGVNDIWKYTPVHDLVVIDPPWEALDPLYDRFHTIVRSNPERLWLYPPNIPPWRRHLPKRLYDKVHRIDLNVFDIEEIDPIDYQPLLTKHPYDHFAATPAGTTTLAWSQGARRIGFLGVDLIPGDHNLSKYTTLLSWFFGAIARQAERLHGRIVNLSPISTVNLAINPRAIHIRRELQPLPF